MGLIRSRHQQHNRNIRDPSKKYYNQLQRTSNTKGCVAMHNLREGSFPG